MMANKAKNESRLSISNAKAMLKGKMALGRYIFFISPSLLMKDVPDCVTTELKNVHGTMPANRKTAKALKFVLYKAENTRAITDIINSGFINVHR
jgi:hypothetical protein